VGNIHPVKLMHRLSPDFRSDQHTLHEHLFVRIFRWRPASSWGRNPARPPRSGGYSAHRPPRDPLPVPGQKMRRQTAIW
jgi:hypothetical protein